MKTTGIIKHIDGLGRLDMPREICRIYGINEGDPMEIYAESGEIKIRKHTPEKDYIYQIRKLMRDITEDGSMNLETRNITMGRLHDIINDLGYIEEKKRENTYYFTFGSSGQIFEGGWVEIRAVNLTEAQQKFLKRFGREARNEKTGLLRYSNHYTKENFPKTAMAKDGNYGNRCHEVIY